MPLILYALFAGGFGWSVHKKKWGVAAFFGAMLLWMWVNQIAIAISMRPVAF
jgi:phosphotransferase system  glucose/maltose/N-acetylglucosamine-specific IIC component